MRFNSLINYHDQGYIEDIVYKNRQVYGVKLLFIEYVNNGLQPPINIPDIINIIYLI